MQWNGAGINHLRNILTLTMNLHDQFDNLDLWFERVPGMANMYDVGAPNDELKTGLPSHITFSMSTQFPLPDPELLALHAAAARITHLSGAVEYLEFMEYQDSQELYPMFLTGSDFTEAVVRHLERIAVNCSRVPIFE
ncbi:hypothetical protein DFH07DRAFT_735069 [Mycena maculata]|uniref:HNH nuclease domain-containing protein n=1 Tax=Mycena maculata TaxID=230809 RepID=A0AAD7JSY6_9AGAR|nr:hypothetical protein DFH07DRAFT_735069 [Mycena maculata]